MSEFVKGWKGKNERTYEFKQDLDKAKEIDLHCPKCKRTMSVERQDTDYPEAVRLEVTCNECDDGDFAESFYYDSAGKHIIRDPNMPISEGAAAGWAMLMWNEKSVPPEVEIE